MTEDIKFDELHNGSSSTNTFHIAKGQHEYVEKTVDISQTGTKVIIKTEGDSLISLNISGDSSVSYSLDVGPTESVDFKDEETYSGTDIRDSFQLVDKYLAIRTTSSGSTNDEAIITIQEAR